ncbi:hypothetical protein [Legionella oakridgensis]|uniref:Uncharacterized protein n=2 Tax=Legionella oakridgensis TaxID=29423 RepID=W0BF26_9GAMM|nr:hypothetical protein [Legionella oakridgensis]AHE67039.1 hypothetical protein Loa_01488 [Legionella oakridgensis ATCC 33761 = DSM 21215]ETO93324.1 hypothetical protein LOR_79c23020 [Legionella oakridgensis RV-2-2007]KTD37189.1 hypothetical protein Loak_2325 [Legionella oakridgensis]STY20133.1 Uncharacterised protein [Legionella longbeachae]
MLGDLTVRRDSEFFISIAKQGIHSFIMLGVVGADGSPQLLARVGKTNDIDPDFASQATMTRKAILSQTMARLADEGITRRDDHVADVNYKAYAITYNQFKQFLELIGDIERRQLANPAIRDAVRDERIQCYIPIESGVEADSITLKYQTLEGAGYHRESSADSAIVTGAQSLHVSNTCRTTSLNILESILGFKTKVSRHFFIDPDYKSTLRAGQPDKDSFYILPPPPNTCHGVSTQQQYVLEKLYARLEKIPKIKPEDTKTREKFDKLKELYTQLAGKNQLSASELLVKINDHEATNKTVLHEKRDPGVFSRLFSTSTEKMYKEMRKHLEGEEKKEEDGLSPK